MQSSAGAQAAGGQQHDLRNIFAAPLNPAMFAQLAANGLLGPTPISSSSQGVSSSVPSSRLHDSRSAGATRHSGHGFPSPPMLSRSYAPGFPNKSKHSNSHGQPGYPHGDPRHPINTSFDFAKPHSRSAAHSRNHSGQSPSHPLFLREFIVCV